MAYDDRHDERGRYGPRGGSRGDYGRGGYGRDDDDRGFFERAGDEVRSWFGDDDAERRRERDYRRHGEERGEWGGGRDYGRDDDRSWRGGDRYSGRGPGWRGDEGSFGGGWGNQTPRAGGPRRGRNDDREDRWDNDYSDRNRYGSGVSEGYGAGGGFGPSDTRPDSVFGAPGFDAEFAGPRFDRADAGHTGTHGVHPVASSSGGAYGGGYGTSAAGFGSSARRYAATGQNQGGDRGSPRGGSDYDPHYQEWRNRRIEEIDRDYDEYRREHQSRFDQDFSAWRERRGEQRRSMGKVREHMEVIGSDGKHIGTVDKVRGERIILTKNDENAGGIHHSIPCSWIESVDEKVRVNKSADEAMNAWREEERSRALFEREDQGRGGPHMLNRSFSGTYSDRND
jgi:hypothetical protein